MEFYHLKSFLTVAEEQHLTRAARRLHISQPSVSTHIRDLEQELGLALFIRTPKGMVLSPEGKMIKSKAESALLAVNAVRHLADRLKKTISGVVRIGLNIDAQFLKVSELNTRLHHQFHRLERHYSQRHSLEAVDLIHRAQLDVAFVFNSSTDPELASKRLSTVDIAIVAPYQWKKRLDDMGLEGLLGLPWIWTDDRCPFNRIANQIFEPLNRMPEKKVVVDNDTTIRKLVASGAGLGLMVGSEADDAARRKEAIVLMPRVATLDLSVIYLQQRASEPMVGAVVQTIYEIWDQTEQNEQNRGNMDE